MKKGLLLILICVIQLVTYSQKKITDTTKIFGVTKDDNVFVGTKLTDKGYKSGEDFTMPPRSAVFVIGAKSYKMESGRMFEYFEIAYKGKTYFIYREDMILITKGYTFEDLLNLQNYKLDSFINYNIILSDVYSELQKNNVLKFIESCRPKGLVVLKNSIYDESEYTEGTSFTFEIENLSKRILKYITFNIIGYNAVDDKVTDRGSSLKSVKGVGPIGKNESGSFSFPYVWFTDIVQSFKVISIKIDYMDGSSSIIDNPKNITLSAYQLKLITEK
jgi:hypothetical protein